MDHVSKNELVTSSVNNDHTCLISYQIKTKLNSTNR